MSLLSDSEISPGGSDITAIVLLTILTVVTLFAAVVFICRYIDSDMGKHSVALIVILGLGFTVRLICALCVRGSREEYAMFADMFDKLDTDGVGSYYNGNAISGLYPVTYFIYILFGWLSNVTGLSGYPLGMQFMIKLPLIIADLAAAYGVYKIAARYFDRGVAYCLCALFSLCPVFFIASSLWTAQSVITVAFFVFAFYALARKRYATTITLSTFAAFSSKEGIYIFPAIAVFGGYHFVRAILNIRRDKPSGKDMTGPEYCAVYSVPASFILSFVAVYLLGLFMTASYGKNPFVYIYEFLLEPLVSWSSFTYNGLSVYAMFGQNGAEPGARFPAWVFVGIFIAILFAVTCIVYFSKRNRATMVMLAAFSLFTMQVYYPGSNAIGMYTALAALLVAYALVRDRRLLYVLFLTGFAYVLNTTCVLVNAGYMNDSYIEAAADVNTLMTGGMGGLTIFCAVLALLSHLYLTFVTVSVGMSGQKKMLGNAVGIGASMREFLGGKRAE